MTGLRYDLEALIDEIGVAQRDLHRSGKDAALAELLGHGYIWLGMLRRSSSTAIEAIELALSDAPWIAHHGKGDPPRSIPDYVQVKFRDGDTECGVRWDWDQNWSWGETEHPGDIVAYRFLVRQ